MGFRFEKSHTADTFISPDTRLRGDGWASFLLGIVDSQSRIRTIPLNRPRDEFYGFYIQDDFKLSPRITLNLGLRWEYETPMDDPELRLSRFLDLTNPIPEFQANPPQFPTQVTVAGRATANPERRLDLHRRGQSRRLGGAEKPVHAAGRDRLPDQRTHGAASGLRPLPGAADPGFRLPGQYALPGFRRNHESTRTARGHSTGKNQRPLSG